MPETTHHIYLTSVTAFKNAERNWWCCSRSKIRESSAQSLLFRSSKTGRTANWPFHLSYHYDNLMAKLKQYFCGLLNFPFWDSMKDMEYESDTECERQGDAAWGCSRLLLCQQLSGHGLSVCVRRSLISTAHRASTLRLPLASINTMPYTIYMHWGHSQRCSPQNLNLAHLRTLDVKLPFIKEASYLWSSLLKKY